MSKPLLLREQGSCGKHTHRTWCAGALPGIQYPQFQIPPPLLSMQTRLPEVGVLAIILVFMPRSLAFTHFSRLLSSSGPDLCSQRKHVNISSLVGLHIMATTHNTCLSGKPQAANMLRQAEQKTLLCTGEGSFWRALWP